jgi:hypothetical protein
LTPFVRQHFGPTVELLSVKEAFRCYLTSTSSLTTSHQMRALCCHEDFRQTSQMDLTLAMGFLPANHLRRPNPHVSTYARFSVARRTGAPSVQMSRIEGCSSACSQFLRLPTPNLVARVDACGRSLFLSLRFCLRLRMQEQFSRSAISYPAEIGSFWPVLACRQDSYRTLRLSIWLGCISPFLAASDLLDGDWQTSR